MSIHGRASLRQPGLTLRKGLKRRITVFDQLFAQRRDRANASSRHRSAPFPMAESSSSSSPSQPTSTKPVLIANWGFRGNQRRGFGSARPPRGGPSRSVLLFHDFMRQSPAAPRHRGRSAGRPGQRRAARCCGHCAPRTESASRRRGLDPPPLARRAAPGAGARPGCRVSCGEAPRAARSSATSVDVDGLEQFARFVEIDRFEMDVQRRSELPGRSSCAARRAIAAGRLRPR